jgi:UDP-N-acetylmuramate dehydrogenase
LNSLSQTLPSVRGKLSFNVPLAPYTWLRVGGAADALFIPKDEADLANFLSAVPQDIPITILGAASNTLVRGGGVRGVVIRLGPSFGQIKTDGLKVTAGAAALDNNIAKRAAKAGIAGLEFYAGIPGTIGGALRMNAGCYGGETKDVLQSVAALDRRGRRQILSVSDMATAIAALRLI